MHDQRTSELPDRHGLAGVVAGRALACGDAGGGVDFYHRIRGSHFLRAGLTGGEKPFHEGAEGRVGDPDGDFRHHGDSDSTGSRAVIYP